MVNIALQHFVYTKYTRLCLCLTLFYTLGFGIVVLLVLYVIVPQAYNFPLISHSLALYQNKAYVGFKYVMVPKPYNSP